MMQHLSNPDLAERQRPEAEFHAAIHHLSDQISHDFRTPLTVIREFATLMHDGLVGTVSPRQREYLDVINDRADDLILIVDNMLDTGKSGAGTLRAWRQPIDPGEIVRGVQASLSRKAAIKGVRLDVAVEPDLRPVYADREQLARILKNVVAGVLKKFEEPQAVRLWASSGEKPYCVDLGVTVEGGRIGRKRLAAIDAAIRHQATRGACHARGAAWPFAVARRLTDLHFGRIRLHRPKDGRTTFCVSVPAGGPRQVLDAYLRHLASRSGGLPMASLIAATIDPEAPSAVAGVVDEFLQSSVDSEDLVIQVGENRWLLVALGSELAVENLLVRVDSAWHATRDAAPGGLLPRLELANLGPCSLCSLDYGAEDLITRFDAETAATSDATEELVASNQY